MLKSISKIEIVADRQELVLTEEQGKLSNRILDLFGEFVNSDIPAEEQFRLFDELNGLADQSINNQETYLKTLKSNRDKYEDVGARSSLLLDKRGDFAKKYLASQDVYYQTEIESTEESLVSDALIKNLLTVVEDRVVMDEYETNTPQYFSQIASLEKYTRNDFVFAESDKIRMLYPYGHEVLDRYKVYMSSFYSVIRDEVGKDSKSANYKRIKLAQTKLNLNIDFDKFFNEGENRRRERGQKIIKSTAQKVQLIKEFKEKRLGVYPFLPIINQWKEDLALCGIYSYKTGYYNLITNKYPEAANFDQLLVELSEVAPKTDEVDKKFDKSIMRFSNSDSEMSFECTDRDDGRTFTNLINK